jgi:hypothetical protein
LYVDVCVEPPSLCFFRRFWRSPVTPTYFQPALDLLIQLSNGQGCHALSECNACIAVKVLVHARLFAGLAVGETADPAGPLPRQHQRPEIGIPPGIVPNPACTHLQAEMLTITPKSRRGFKF